MEDVDPVELPAFGIPAPKCAMASPRRPRRGRGRRDPTSPPQKVWKIPWKIPFENLDISSDCWYIDVFFKFTRCWLFMSRISYWTMRARRREVCCAANLFFIASICAWCHLEKEHDKSEGGNAKFIRTMSNILLPGVSRSSEKADGQEWSTWHTNATLGTSPHHCKEKSHEKKNRNLNWMPKKYLQMAQ